MNENQVELYNVVETERDAHIPGLRLQRFAKSAREVVNPTRRFVSREASGCEIRFVTDAKVCGVALTLADKDGEVLVYQGDYFHSRHRLSKGVIETIQLEDKGRWGIVHESALQKRRYDYRVWRICLDNYEALFHGVEAYGCTVRPPTLEEKPRIRWLAYGSSITHGESAEHVQNAYAHQAAIRLGVDVLNLGLRGSCLCEPEVADFFASRQDWDFATFELGVNMRGHYSPEQFQHRLDYFIRTICGAWPDKPVILITSYPNLSDYELEESVVGRHQLAYNASIRELVRSRRYDHLQLIEGADVLTEFSGLAADLIHPSSYGHALMGENLARLLQDKIGTQRS